jgi:hypothetical protein
MKKENKNKFPSNWFEPTIKVLPMNIFISKLDKALENVILKTKRGDLMWKVKIGVFIKMDNFLSQLYCQKFNGLLLILLGSLDILKDEHMC